MSKRTSGVLLCFAGAFLMGIRFISASILGMSSEMGKDAFKFLLNSLGNTLPVFIFIFLAVGFAYLIYAEITENK